MGQRSQIYVRYEQGEEHNRLIAQYYGWNFAERMVSRAASTIDYIASMAKYNEGSPNKVVSREHEKIGRMLDVNFDMRDIADSSDIIQEYGEFLADCPFNQTVFQEQDNNDGKLFIDVSSDTIKYAFTDDEISKPMTAKEYMDWDTQYYKEARETYGLSEQDLDILKRNMQTIETSAVLMTPEELQQFVTADYSYELQLRNIGGKCMNKLYSEDHEYEIERIQGTDQYAVKEDGAFWTKEDNTVQLMDNSEVFNDVLLSALEERYGYDTDKNAEVVSYEDFLKEMQEQNVTLSAADIQIVAEQLNAPAYTEEQVQDFLKEQIQQLCDSDGMRDVSPVRGEALSPEFVMQSFKEYQESNEGFETFSQFLDYQLIEKNGIDIQEMDLLIDEIRDNASHQNEKLLDCLNDYLEKADSVEEVLEEAGYNGISYELTDFLCDDYKLNLMLATEKEQDMDMGSIPSVFLNHADNIHESYADDEKYGFNNDIDNALTWLIHQQGHEVSEVYAALTENMEGQEGFIASVVREIQDCPVYSMMETTVSISASGQNLLDTLDVLSGTSDKNLEISRDSSVALFNEWQGTCSNLEIELESPVIIPADMIRNVQMEGAGRIGCHQ